MVRRRVPETSNQVREELEKTKELGNKYVEIMEIVNSSGTQHQIQRPKEATLRDGATQSLLSKGIDESNFENAKECTGFNRTVAAIVDSDMHGCISLVGANNISLQQ